MAIETKYPDLKIAIAESGIGCVAMLCDRLDNTMSRSGYGSGRPDKHTLPSDELRRYFGFCMIDDPSTISTATRSASTTSSRSRTTRTATARGPTRSA